MERRKALLVSVDMKLNDEVIKYLNESDCDVDGLLITDNNLLQIITDLFVEKGWLGGWSAKELTERLSANQETLKKLMSKELESKLSLSLLDIKETNGNLKEILIQEVKERKPDEVLFSYGKGFNPIWEASKPVIERICENDAFKCKVFR